MDGMNFPEVIFWTLGLGILGTAIYELIIYLIRTYILNHGSEYSGIWNDAIYDNNNNVVKIDEIKMQHNKRTDEFVGRITRKMPVDQDYRKWKCKGVFRNNVMLMVFWPEKNLLSYGVMYLVLDGDFKYKGYYLKYENGKNDIEKVKVTCEKVQKP